MTKGKVLREYLSKFYGVEAKGMSVASVLRDYFTKKYNYVPNGNSMISILQDCIANDVGGGGDKPEPTPEPTETVLIEDTVASIYPQEESNEGYLTKAATEYQTIANNYIGNESALKCYVGEQEFGVSQISTTDIFFRGPEGYSDPGSISFVHSTTGVIWLSKDFDLNVDDTVKIVALEE